MPTGGAGGRTWRAVVQLLPFAPIQHLTHELKNGRRARLSVDGDAEVSGGLSGATPTPTGHEAWAADDSPDPWADYYANQGRQTHVPWWQNWPARTGPMDGGTMVDWWNEGGQKDPDVAELQDILGVDLWKWVGSKRELDFEKEKERPSEKLQV